MNELFIKIELEEKLGRSLENDQLESALSLVQQTLETAEKNTKGYNFKYANMVELIDASRPALTANGFNVRHRYMKIDGQWCIRMILAHKSGQWTSSDYPIREVEDGKRSIEQCTGSWMTYFMRHQYKAMIGIKVDDESDNDGHRDKQSTKTQVETKSNYITDVQLKFITEIFNQYEDLEEQVKKQIGISNLKYLYASKWKDILQVINSLTGEKYG